MRGERAYETITFEDIDWAAGVLEAMVFGIDVDTLTGEGATRLVKRLVVHERVVASVRAKAAKRAADANQWRHAGERSPASWLASLTGTTTGQAAAELETSRRLVDLPATAAARAAGELSDLQAQRVADAATADPTSEADLLAHAATDDAAALARRCLAVKAAAERDETAAREKIRRARRHRSWTDGEGAYCYAGRGLPEDRATLEAALKPYQDQAFHAARRRGERESSEAYAYDALIALANHQCPTATAGTDTKLASSAGTGPEHSTADTDTTPAPGADEEEPTGRQSPAGETPGAATLWAETTTDPSTTAAEAAAGPSTSGTEVSGDGPSRNGHGPPGAQAASAATNTPATDPRRASRTAAYGTSSSGDGSPRNGHGTPGAHAVGAATNTPATNPREAQPESTHGTGSSGDGPSRSGHSSAGTEATPTTVTAGDTGTGDDEHATDMVTGTGADPRGAASTSGTAATGSGAGPTSLRLGARAKVIVRIDHAALVRGHTVPGEVCEIAGIGPIPVATARELARDAFLTAVVADGVDVRSVAHLGRAATAHQRTALEARGMHCAVPGCGAVHHLEIDHVDGWAITRRTHLEQLDWLCRFHHRQKTHDSYRLAGPPGQRTWHPPDCQPPPATPPGDPPPG